MPAQLFDLVDDLSQDPPKRDAIEQGTTFNWTVTFEAADTDATAPGDWLARMQVRRALADKDTSETPLIDLDSDLLGGVTITITPGATYDAVHLDITATPTQTVALPIGKWHYDIELVRLSDGYTRRLAKGRAQVAGEVTR